MAGTATISTDKSDYAPGETVSISGSGFTPSTPLSVFITRPDSTVESCDASSCNSRFTNGKLISDGGGAFFNYSYLLDGIMGNYSIAVSDGTNSAQTNFTDSSDTGSIWTSRGGCSVQDENHYGPGEAVYINGNNFPSGSKNWEIKGKSGSCDPDTVVAGGAIIGASFCFNAYTINNNDCGEYTAKVSGKTDNYQVTCVDRDNDGYYAGPYPGCTTGNDCNDANAAIHPGATEVCNDQIDNNCNGLTDCADPDCIGNVACYTRPCGTGTDLCNWNKVLPLGSPDNSNCGLSYNTYWPIGTEQNPSLTSATCTFDGTNLQNTKLYVSIDNDVIQCTLNGNLIFSTRHEGCAAVDPRTTGGGVGQGYQVAISPTAGSNTIVCDVSDRGVMSHFDACVVGATVVCGNGILESGEQCEKNQDGSWPVCCDSSTCQFKSSQTVCRSASGPCDVAETCTGQSAECPSDAKAPQGTSCSDGLYCNGAEVCDGNGNCQSGTAINCAGNNIPGIATCDNTPDNVHYTWDYRVAFTSVCNEETDSCTTGCDTISHTCNFATCGAQCDAEHSCQPHLTDSVCYYNGQCNSGSCTCNYQNSANCPVPGTVIEGTCYYGTQSCTANGCGLSTASMDCKDKCDPVLGPIDTTGPTTSGLSIQDKCNKLNITATETDTCSNIAGAEYFFDECPATSVRGTPLLAKDGSFDQKTEIVYLDGIDVKSLTDGRHTLYVRGKDANGNWGSCNSTAFDVDIFPPYTPQQSASTPLSCGGTSTITATALVCESPSFNQSFICNAEYYLDNFNLGNGEGFQMQPVNGNFGDSYCEWVTATVDTSQLSEGTHHIQVHGVDCSCNWGKLTAIPISFIKDTVSPVTTKTLIPYGDVQRECTQDDISTAAPPHSLTDGCEFVKSGTQIILNAHDIDTPDHEYSDNVAIHWKVWYKVNPGDEWALDQQGVGQINQSVTITLNKDSYHLIEYWSVDACSNEETHHYELDIVDTKAPTIIKTVGDPKSGTCPPQEGDNCFITSGTTIHVVSSDQQPHPVDQVKCDWSYTVNGGEPIIGGTNVKSPFDITFPQESTHVLTITCEDALGNSVSDTETFLVDKTPPTTEKTYGKPLVTTDGGYPKWITSATPITLTVDDTGTHKSGIKQTEYRVTLVGENYCANQDECQDATGSDGKWNTYYLPFEIADQSCHLIEYYSVDNVGNTETIKKQCVYVDNTGPSVSKSLSAPLYPSRCTNNCYVTQNTLVSLSCTDQNSHPVGADKIYYRIYNDNVLIQDWTPYIEPFHFAQDTEHRLEWYCVDKLGNMGQTSTETDFVDTQPPVTTKSFDGPHMAGQGFTWITQNTDIILSCTDPEPHPVDHTTIYYKYKLDDGNYPEQWTVYDGPFHFNEDSVHTLQYYCFDVLGNTEQTQTEVDKVDSTPPTTTKTYGEPIFMLENLEKLGKANSEWTQEQASTGTHSVKLVIPDNAAGTDFAGVDSFFDVFVNLNSINSLTYDRKVTQFDNGWSPIVILGIDTNGDGKFDAKPLEWEASGYNPALLGGDSFIQCEATTKLTGTDSSFTNVDVYNSFACYTPNVAGNNYDWSVYQPLSYFQTHDVGRIETTDKVAMVKVELGGNPSTQDNEIAYVDNVQLNGKIIINEPITWITSQTPITLSVDDTGYHKSGIQTTYWRNTLVSEEMCNNVKLCQCAESPHEEVFALTGDVHGTVTKTDNGDSFTWTIHITDPSDHYGTGIALATGTSQPAFQVWYREYEQPFGWYYQDYGTGWNGAVTPLPTQGISATGDYTGGTEKTFTITIPKSKLGNSCAQIYWGVQARTTLLGKYPSTWQQWAGGEAEVSGMAVSSTGSSGSWNIYKGPFTKPEESCHLIEYYSVDALGNAEKTKKQCVYVENTPPLTTKTVGEPKVPKGECAEGQNCDYFIKMSTPITLSCSEQGPHPTGVTNIYYSYKVDDKDWTSWTQYQSPFTYPEESNHLLKYYCKDALGNTEVVQYENDSVDDTPPVITDTHVSNCAVKCDTEVKIFAKVTDAKVGVETVTAQIQNPDGDEITTIDLTYNPKTGYYKGTWTPECDSELSEGTYYVDISASDLLSNAATQDNGAFINLDNTRPTVYSVFTGRDWIGLGDKFYVDAEVTDNSLQFERTCELPKCYVRIVDNAEKVGYLQGTLEFVEGHYKCAGFVTVNDTFYEAQAKLWVDAFDAANNSGSAEKLEPIGIDNSRMISITGIVESPWYKGGTWIKNVVATVDSSKFGEVTSCLVSISGVSPENTLVPSGNQCVGNIRVPVDISDGKKNLTISAININGKTVSDSVNIRIDNTPPVKTIYSPQNGTMYSSKLPIVIGVNDLGSGVKNATYRIVKDPLVLLGLIPLPWTGYDSGWITLTFNGSTFNDTFDTAPLQSGTTYYLSTIVCDNVGNCVDPVIYFGIDKDAPTWSSGTQLTVTNSPIDIDGNISLSWPAVTDTLSGVDHYNVRVYNSTGYLLSYSSTTQTHFDISNLPNGLYTFNVTAVDRAMPNGNENSGLVGSTTVDRSCSVDVICTPSPQVHTSTSSGGGGGGGGGGGALVMPEVSISGATSISQGAGTDATYQVQVKNTGTGSGTYILSISGIPSSWYTVSSSTVIQSGSSATMSYTLNLPADAVDSKFTVIVTAPIGLLVPSDSYSVLLNVLRAPSAPVKNETPPVTTENVTGNVTASSGVSVITGYITAVATNSTAQIVFGSLVSVILLIFLIRYGAGKRKPWRSNFTTSGQIKNISKLKKQIKKGFR